MKPAVAILAGGLATRLRPITERIPKSLVEVAGRPFAEHQIELLRAHGLTDIVFLVGHLGQILADALGDGSRYGVRLRYVFDGPRPLGTGGALRRALPELGDPFFVLYGDSYLECDYEDIERAFAQSGKPALMTVCRNDDRWDRSNVLFVDGRIVCYDKQRRTSEMSHIDYGLGVFSAQAFRCGREAPASVRTSGRPGVRKSTDGNETAGRVGQSFSCGHSRPGDDEAFDLATLYQELLARDELAGYEVPTRFYEIGSPEGLEETRRYLASVAARRSERRPTAGMQGRAENV